ncbi:MAG: hypothetical protein IPL73_19445 [Candidatus Obscuribacter sp.]|nr:hypothetical protein [Candidatus Obscuribacter sp.]
MKSRNPHTRIYLLSGSRTPVGSFGRTLRNVPVDKLAGHVMVNAIRRAGVDANSIDHVILGHGYQSSYTPNTAALPGCVQVCPLVRRR